MTLLPLQLLVFALSHPLSGNAISSHFPHLTTNHQGPSYINTTLRADHACQIDARRMGYHSSYVAMLSAKMRSLRNLVPQHYHHLPVVNVKVGGGEREGGSV